MNGWKAVIRLLCLSQGRFLDLFYSLYNEWARSSASPGFILGREFSQSNSYIALNVIV